MNSIINFLNRENISFNINLVNLVTFKVKINNLNSTESKFMSKDFSYLIVIRDTINAISGKNFYLTLYIA